MSDQSGPPKDPATGQFAETVDREAVLDAVRRLEDASTRDVVEAVDAPYRTVFRALEDLEDDGRVAHRKVGNANLWFTAE